MSFFSFFLSFFLGPKFFFFIIFICFLRDTKKESKIKDRIIIKLSLSICHFLPLKQHDFDETTKEKEL